jgi:type I restriction enzyme M protein
MAPFKESLGAVGIMDLHKIVAVFVTFRQEMAYDLKSVAASGFTPELIPDNLLISRMFPEVLEGLKQREERLEEIDALFNAADSQEAEEDEDNVQLDDVNGVLPKAIAKKLKQEQNTLGGQLKALARKQRETGVHIETENADIQEKLAAVNEQLKRHLELEEERKQLRAEVSAAKKEFERLVEDARKQITPNECREIILDRFYLQLQKTMENYLRQHLTEMVEYLERLWEKYRVTLREIESERDQEAQKLNEYFIELEYLTY